MPADLEMAGGWQPRAGLGSTFWKWAVVFPGSGVVSVLLAHQEERLARQAAVAWAQAAESLLQPAERCAWLRPPSGRPGKTGCWKRRQSCRSAGPQVSLASQGWDGSTPLASASVRKRPGVHGLGMRTAADRVAWTRGACAATPQCASGPVAGGRTPAPASSACMLEGR